MKQNAKKKAKTKRFQSPRRLPPTTPVLRFTPTAWAKLLFLRDHGETEVGGFGIACSDDLLLIQDIQLVKQTCTWAHVSFDDDSVADFFDSQVDAGHRPEQFARVWIHTHPGDCPQPSLTDESTFTRVFGQASWAVMFILAQQGESYARLRFNVGPGGTISLPVEVDYRLPFTGSDLAEWEQQYLANVEPTETALVGQAKSTLTLLNEYDEDWLDDWSDYVDQFDDRLTKESCP